MATGTGETTFITGLCIHKPKEAYLLTYECKRICKQPMNYETESLAALYQWVPRLGFAIATAISRRETLERKEVEAYSLLKGEG